MQSPVSPAVSTLPTKPALATTPRPTNPPVSTGASWSPQNRLLAVLMHVPYYSIEGPARVAADAGVARSTVCRLIRGQSLPSFRLMWQVAAAIEKRLGNPVDPRDLFTFDGRYPTASVCTLCGCRGCLPDHFYNDEDELKTEYEHVRSGEWSLNPAYLPRKEVA
jgi:hypothetical protein